MLNIPKNVDSLSTGFAPMPGDVRASRGGRLVAECRDETTCLRTIVLTGHKVSPDPTRHEQDTPKWNFCEHLNQRRQKRATN